MNGEVIYCGACGAAISSDSKFCEYCGAKIFLENENGQLKELGSYGASHSGNEVLMVEDVFTITGRGTVVTGKSLAIIKVGMNIVNNRTSNIHSIRGIEQFRKVSNSIEPGKNCGLLLSGERSDFQRGDMLIAH